ncbi:MAG TPA: retropepsin-like aspartic protease, partial [Verrucomicrobiae bacterium]|nr:retropepsin-like aspartic protease [Verrucomicrobiae bacterium]
EATCVLLVAMSPRPRAAALMLMMLLSPHSLPSAESPTNTAGIRLPIEFRRGSLHVPVVVNGSNSLSFKVDTGFGVTTVHPDLVEKLQLKRAGFITIVGIAGEEKADTYEGAKFNFGGATYSPRRVTVLPSEAQSRRRRDGILGAGFFRRFVVEIDSANRTMTLYEPRGFQYSGKGEVIPLEFRRDTPIVEAAINFTNRAPVWAKFEIDSGCDGELCLGHDFVEKNRLDDETGHASSRSGVGGSVDTRHGKLPQFQLGKATLDNLPANFFSEGSPAGEGLAGHIGMGTLRHFKVIFDYSRKQMILESAK